MRLAELRERRGVTQSEVRAFSQSAIYKLKKRKDMKVSILVEYSDEIGLKSGLPAFQKVVMLQGLYSWR